MPQRMRHLSSLRQHHLSGCVPQYRSPALRIARCSPSTTHWTVKTRPQLAHSHPQRRSARIRLTASPPATPPLPPLLDPSTPILPLLHTFLDDADAARLLRTSRTAALALLSGYAFTSHTFQPTSLIALRRLRDLCVEYKLRIRQVG